MDTLRLPDTCRGSASPTPPSLALQVASLAHGVPAKSMTCATPTWGTTCLLKGQVAFSRQALVGLHIASVHKVPHYKDQRVPPPLHHALLFGNACLADRPHVVQLHVPPWCACEVLLGTMDLLTLSACCHRNGLHVQLLTVQARSISVGMHSCFEGPW